MRACRENLNKLKSLCDELSDRDNQLKINATTLWDLLEGIHDTKEMLLVAREEEEDIRLENIDAAVKRLSRILTLATERGCKRVFENE